MSLKLSQRSPASQLFVRYVHNIKFENKMKSWQQELNDIPTDKNGKKECTDSESALIVLKFLKEEIHPRFGKVKSELSSQDLNIEISPESKDDISNSSSSVSISIKKKFNIGICIFSLRFNKGDDYLTIDSELIHRNGNKTLGSIAIGITDEHNSIELVDSYIKSLSDSIK